jgi:hypothetical protein
MLIIGHIAPLAWYAFQDIAVATRSKRVSCGILSVVQTNKLVGAVDYVLGIPPYWRLSCGRSGTLKGRKCAR